MNAQAQQVDPITRYTDDITAVEACYEVTITVRCQDLEQVRAVTNALASVGRQVHPYKRFGWVSRLARRGQNG